MMNDQPSCAIVCIAKCEQDYIKEFVYYHRFIGICRFFIYDNDCLPADDPNSLSNILKDESDCTVLSIPQMDHVIYTAYNHFISQVMPLSDIEWFAFIDLDEFICPIKHKSIQEFIKEYGHYKALGLNWRLFSADHNITKPENVLLGYTKSKFNDHVKTLAHRSALKNASMNLPNVMNPEMTRYSVHNVGGQCCDLYGNKLYSSFCLRDFTHIIRINHYATKSWQELIAKSKRRMTDGTHCRVIDASIPALLSFGYEEDKSILELLDIEVPPNNKSSVEEIIQLKQGDLLNELQKVKLQEAIMRCPLHDAYVDALTAIKGVGHDKYTKFANELYVELHGGLASIIRTLGVKHVCEIGIEYGVLSSAVMSTGEEVQLTSFETHSDKELISEKDQSRIKNLVKAFYPQHEVETDKNAFLTMTFDMIILSSVSQMVYESDLLLVLMENKPTMLLIQGKTIVPDYTKVPNVLEGSSWQLYLKDPQ